MRKNELGDWLVKQAALEEAEIPLEEGLFWGTSGPLLRKRMLRSLARRLVACALILTELWLLGTVFPASDLGWILYLRTFSYILIAGAWGAQEADRSQLLEFWKKGNPVDFARLWGASIRKATLLSLSVMIASLIWVIKEKAANHHILNILDAYAFLILAGFGVDLWVRTLYSGVYAVQRIYQPVWLGAALEWAVFGAVWLEWNRYGIWGIIYARALLILIRSGTILIYTFKASRRLGLRPGWVAKGIRTRIGIRDRLFPALAFIVMRSEHWLMIGTLGREALVFVLFLLAPFFYGSSSWIFSFQNDLARLSRQGGASLRFALDKNIRPWLWVSPVVMVAIIAFILPAFLLKLSPLSVFSTLAFMWSRNLLLWHQLLAYSEKHYAKVVMSGGAFVLTGFLIGWNVQRIDLFLGLATASMLVITLIVRTASKSRPPNAPLVPYKEQWMARVESVRTPLILVSASVLRLPSTRRSWSEFSESLRSGLPADSFWVRNGKNSFWLAIPCEKPAGSKEQWARALIRDSWKGLLRNFRGIPGENGKQALPLFLKHALRQTAGSKDAAIPPALPAGSRILQPGSHEISQFSKELSRTDRVLLFSRARALLRGDHPPSTHPRCGWSIDGAGLGTLQPEFLFCRHPESKDSPEAREWREARAAFRNASLGVKREPHSDSLRESLFPPI